MTRVVKSKKEVYTIYSVKGGANTNTGIQIKSIPWVVGCSPSTTIFWYTSQRAVDSLVVKCSIMRISSSVTFLDTSVGCYDLENQSVR